jgi:hypothetical protein
VRRDPRPLALREQEPAVLAWGMKWSPEGLANHRRLSAAHTRALNVVARMHPDDFAAAWTDRGRYDSPGYSARRAAALRVVARAHPEDYERALAAEKLAGGVR